MRHTLLFPALLLILGGPALAPAGPPDTLAAAPPAPLNPHLEAH